MCLYIELEMYYSIYYFLWHYLPIVLYRPFLFSSIYPIIIGPLFRVLERKYPNLFVQRAGVNGSLGNEMSYHIVTFVCLCICSLVDPRTFSFTFRELPAEPPSISTFLVYSFGLVMFYEAMLSLLHILFHFDKWLYANIHYIHHLDTDPNVVSTIKLHLQEVLMVFLVMYVIPVRFLDPHPYCLLAAFMATSIMGIMAHSGIKGWYLAEYHRLHHKDPRYNMWNPILSHFDRKANTNFQLSPRPPNLNPTEDW